MNETLLHPCDPYVGVGRPRAANAAPAAPSGGRRGHSCQMALARFLDSTLILVYKGSMNYGKTFFVYAYMILQRQEGQGRLKTEHL